MHTVLETFHAHYHAFCGHSYRGKQEVELVNLRVTGRISLPKPRATVLTGNALRATPKEFRSVYFLDAAGFVDCAVFDRACLGVGARLLGPVVVEQDDTTLLVPPGFSLVIDQLHNAVIEQA